MPHRSYSYRSVTHWLPIARLTVGLLIATLALLTPGLHAPATTPAVADTGDSTIRPILFTTEAEIARAKKRVEDQQQPFYEAWQKTKAQADAALTTTYVPEESYNHETYFGIARPQAQDTRALALVYRITGDQRYADKARQILQLWAADALANNYPGWGSPHQMGLVIGRVIPIFADAYAMLYPQIPTDERTQIQKWFRKMADGIMISRNIFKTASTTCDYGTCTYRGEPGTYLGGNYFSNHLSAHNLGLLAIGYALGDRQMVQEQLNSPKNDRDLKELIDGAIIMPEDIGSGGPNGDLYKGDPTYTEGAPMPDPGEIWDRNRTAQGNGLHYTHLHLQLLVLQADLAKNNGNRDFFGYVGPHGENLRLPFDVYDDFLLTADPGARTGYYVKSSIDYTLLPLYEIAHREYPQDQQIRNVLESFDRAGFIDDHQTFGWTSVLTDGLDDLAIAPNPYPASGKTDWEFDHDGDFEAYTIRKASATVSGGALNLTINQDDPGIVSPDLLGLDPSTHQHVEVRMRNQTNDSQMVIYFITDDQTDYDGVKRVAMNVSANDTDFHTYSVDMGSSASWTGRIRQIRIDPVQGTSTGLVSIDSVHITS